MNQTLQLHNALIFHAEIPNFCTSCCVHVHWFSGIHLNSPLLILTPNCLLTYFVTHRQYFHLIVNKMYVFLGIIYAIYELFNLTN